MNLLLYMAPIAVVVLLPATLFMEENVIGVTLELAREDIRIVWLLLFNSALAYFVNLTNFLVTKHTSALTLQVYLLHIVMILFMILSHAWFVEATKNHYKKRIMHAISSHDVLSLTLLFNCCFLLHLFKFKRF